MTSNNLSSFSQEGKPIQDFIDKLYSILNNPNFIKIISWSNNNCEIEIKDQKKMQTHILPIYFRHQKIQSFIRQLNMYRFGKVNKIANKTKHLFFKNSLFRKENPQLLHLITRKKKGQKQNDTQFYQKLEQYKTFIKSNVEKIQENVNQLKKRHPEVRDQLNHILILTEILIGEQPLLIYDADKSNISTNSVFNQQATFETYNNFQADQFLCHFDSKCSIEIDQVEKLIS